MKFPRFFLLKIFTFNCEVSALLRCDQHIGEESHNLQLNTAFTQKIIKIFALTEVNNATKAQTFACLSALFTKLSSSSFFGEERASPLPLRNFAIALLNKAIEFDATQVPLHAGLLHENFTLSK